MSAELSRTRRRRALATVCGLFLCGGCYSYGIKDLPRVSTRRASVGTSFHPYTVKLKGAAYRRTKDAPASQLRYEDFHVHGGTASRRVLKAAYDYLENSGLFRDVVTGDGVVYDISVDVRLVSIIDPDTERWNPWLGALSTLTLTVVPTWGTSHLVLEVEAATISRETIFSQQYPIRVRTILWLPFAAARLFVYPDPNEELRNAARLALRDFGQAFKEWAKP